MKNQFIIKNFLKRKAVKAFVLYPDKRIRTYWAIPDGNIIKINNMSFLINENDFSLDTKGIPCYIYDISNIEPKNLQNEIKPKKPSAGKTEDYRIITPQDLDTAITAKVATEIFNASRKNMDTGTITLIFSVLSVIAVGVVAYMGFEKLDVIIEKLQELEDLIKLIGGM